MTFVYSEAAEKFKLYECTYMPVAWAAEVPIFSDEGYHVVGSIAPVFTSPH
jgi:hypothetical protein